MKNQSKINKMLNKIICKAHSAKKSGNLADMHDILNSVYDLTEKTQHDIVQLEMDKMVSVV